MKKSSDDKLRIIPFDMISLLLCLFLVISQFLLSFGTTNGKSINAFQLYRIFSGTNWSFSYFPVFVFLILFGFLSTLITLRKEHKTYYPYIMFIWLTALAVLISAGIYQESILKSKIYDVHFSNTGFAVSLFLLMALIINQLLTISYKKGNLGDVLTQFKNFPPFRFLWNFNYLEIIFFVIGIFIGGFFFGLLGLILGAILMLVFKKLKIIFS